MSLVVTTTLTTLTRKHTKTKLKTNKLGLVKKIKQKTHSRCHFTLKTACTSIQITVPIVTHYITKNSSDNLPSYPPHNHHCTDAVYWTDWKGSNPNVFTRNLQI